MTSSSLFFGVVKPFSLEDQLPFQGKPLIQRQQPCVFLPLQRGQLADHGLCEGNPWQVWKAVRISLKDIHPSYLRCVHNRVQVCPSVGNPESSLRSSDTKSRGGGGEGWSLEKLSMKKDA